MGARQISYFAVCSICFGIRLNHLVDESMHQTLSKNKVYFVTVICMKFYMNFDVMILTFYTWICVVHCVHQDKCLKTLHYLNIKIWFY